VNQKTKTDLIGTTRKPEPISQEDFDILVARTIHSGFEWERAISMCFCSRCGTYGETPKAYVEDLIEKMTSLGQTPAIALDDNNPKQFRKYYFVINNCEVCQQEGEQTTKIDMIYKF